MAFGGFEGGDNAQLKAEINTTPFVDVMLVLLVIFIITAPLLQQAIPVDLPRAEAQRIEDKPKVIRLAIDAAGRAYVDDEAVHAQSLESRLLALAAGNPEMHLRADRGTRYERVAEVIAAAQRAGIARIAFVTEPAPR